MGPKRLEKAVWQGRGATFRARTSQDNSKEVVGMAKALSLEETTASAVGIPTYPGSALFLVW
jgi:hypothetical protein